MFTDSMSWEKPSVNDGFIWIIDPNGMKIEGAELQGQLKHESGKVYFQKTYKLPHGQSNPFEFNSKSLLRKKDRLIWTVQDFSECFKVRILNRTGVQDCFEVKINHHKEKSNEHLFLEE